MPGHFGSSKFMQTGLAAFTTLKSNFLVNAHNLRVIADRKPLAAKNPASLDAKRHGVLAGYGSLTLEPFS